MILFIQIIISPLMQPYIISFNFILKIISQIVN